MSILGVRIELFVNDVEHSARLHRKVPGFRPARDADQTGYLPISSGALTIGLQGHGVESKSRLRSMNVDAL